MFLRDLAIYADEQIVERFKGGFVQAFHRDTCCVVEAFGRHLFSKLVSRDTAKVVFKFSDLVSAPPDSLRSVYDIRWPFDFLDYRQLTEDGAKKRQIAEALLAGLVWVAPQVGWDARVIEEAHAEAT